MVFRRIKGVFDAGILRLIGFRVVAQEFPIASIDRFRFGVVECGHYFSGTL